MTLGQNVYFCVCQARQIRQTGKMEKNTKKGRKQERLEQKQARERRQKLFQNLKPLLWAFVAWFVVNAILHIPGIQGPFNQAFVSFTTHAAYWFGTVLFLPVEMNNVPFLTVNGFPMRVVMECTAYTFYLFAITLVIFARWPKNHKITGLAFILLGIFIIINLRFISMGYLGSWRPELFDTVHDIVWNVLFGFMVFGLWAWQEVRVVRSKE